MSSMEEYIELKRSRERELSVDLGEVTVSDSLFKDSLREALKAVVDSDIHLDAAIAKMESAGFKGLVRSLRPLQTDVIRVGTKLLEMQP